MKLTVEFPKVGRKRLLCTLILASIATTLWIAAPAYLPFAVVSWQHVAEGFAIPFSVGWVALLVMEQRITRDLQPADRRQVSEPAEAVTR